VPTGTETIRLTSGNIRNSYIRIHQLNDLITGEINSSNNSIVLDLEGVGQVQTYIDRKKGILADRRGIKRFFETHKLKAGDEVSVEKIGKSHLQLSLLYGRQKMANSTKLNRRIENIDKPYSARRDLPLFGAPENKIPALKRKSTNNLRRANDLNGKEWTSFSISVWKDIRKSSEEIHLDHPAMFPVMLVKRVIQCFTTSSEKIILDPFMGSGSTLVGTYLLGRTGIGFEIYPDYIDLAKQRLAALGKSQDSPSFVIYQQDARKLSEFIKQNSIDLCFTSPPYWNILTQPRTADYKQTKNYGSSEQDLGRIENYEEFLKALGDIFHEVLKALKPRKYCIVNVMDLRKGNQFYPFHSDLATKLKQIGYIFDDIIIWDRSHEYSNLRPLGYPAVFRINKVHEYLLIFQKPR